MTGAPIPFERPGVWSHVLYDNPEAPAVGVILLGEGNVPAVGEDAKCEYRGRLYPAYAEDKDIYLGLDMRRSRLHPASIAGLVVGAMGVFVFGAALRHWLGERRRFADPGTGR
ncbi:MAG: hypothetical protein ACYTFI_11385 [Planctomycetota bacterium]